MSVDIVVQPTPNPNALKFIVNTIVKAQGKASFKSPTQCEEIPLAHDLFDLRGVDQIHFFQNVVTVSKFSFEPWDDLEKKVIQTIDGLIDKHDPEFQIYDPEADRRKNLPPELFAIEEILDKRIRPGLQGDGGDLQCVSFQDNILIIKYQGACGTCPSSTMGTLEAIRGILRDEYDPEIEVYTAPE
jgi:NFU1 iron-sulfur cluster scaffold homolog, mitochondrial